MLSARSVFLFGTLICASMVGVAAYFQMIDHLEPCPLCILRRVFTAAVGVVFLLGFAHNPKRLGIKVYGLFAMLLAIMGASISGRHVWLQNMPADQVPSCGPGLNFMLENFPLNDALNMILKGSGECAEVLWTWLGLSIPAWTLVAFITLTLLSLKLLFWKESRQNIFS